MKVDYKRCDRCHELYDENERFTLKHSNMLIHLNYEEHYNQNFEEHTCFKAEHFDLCPECSKKLMAFFGMEEEDL